MPTVNRTIAQLRRDNHNLHSARMLQEDKIARLLAEKEQADALERDLRNELGKTRSDLGVARDKYDHAMTLMARWLAKYDETQDGQLARESRRRILEAANQRPEG